MTAAGATTPLTYHLKHRRFFEVLFWTLSFMINATGNTITTVMDLRRDGFSVAAWEPAVWEFSSGVVILALLPLILVLERRFPFRYETWKRSLGVHALATVPFSIVHVSAMVFIRHVVYAAVGHHYDFGNVGRQFLYEYLKDARTYFLLLGIVHAYRIILLRLQGEVRLLAAPDDAPPVESVDRPDRFLVRKLGKEFLIAAADIECLEAAGNYVNLHVRGRQYPLRSTMAAIESRLDPRRFQRVHRSYIVNLDQIAEIEPLDTGDARLLLKNGERISCSRTHREALRLRAAWAPDRIAG